MKQFTNIQDWLKTKPSDLEMNRVLEFINKNAKNVMRRELAQKQSELKKINRLITDLNQVGFKPSKDMEDMYAERLKEVETLTLEIGAIEKTVKLVRKVKNKESEVSVG